MQHSPMLSIHCRLAKKFESGAADIASAANKNDAAAAKTAYTAAAASLASYLEGCELEPLGDAVWTTP